jgi:hypothetical protein
MLWFTIEYRLPACALKNYAPLAAPIFCGALWSSLIENFSFLYKPHPCPKTQNPNSKYFRESNQISFVGVHCKQVSEG